MNWKPKLKIIIPILAVGVVAAVSIRSVQSIGAKPKAQIINTYTLETTDLRSTVDVTGMVESNDAEDVYNTLPYAVDKVFVEVGDVVQQGDVLCKLDTAELELSIAQSVAALENAKEKANFGIAVAEKDLETAVFNNEKDYNQRLLQAENAVKQAENALESAEHACSAAQKDLDDALNNQLVMETNTYTTTLDTESRIEGYRQRVEQANITRSGAEQTLEAAKAALEATKMVEKESIVATEDSVTNAKLNANFSDQEIAINKLRKTVSDATIYAPISGTVTAVYAKEGSTGSGLLFKVENTEDLKVRTKIKEYDIGNVQLDMPVLIKADATGNAEHHGTLTMISPTTLKDPTGKTVDTTSAEFEAEVKVDTGSNLRIGMNTRMNIITQDKSAILAVPLEAVALDEDGNDIVFVYKSQPDGTYIAKAVAVELGMETEVMCEISSDELQAGDEVILNIDEIVDGMQVIKADAEPAKAESAETTPTEESSEASEQPEDEESASDQDLQV